MRIERIKSFDSFLQPHGPPMLSIHAIHPCFAFMPIIHASIRPAIYQSVPYHPSIHSFIHTMSYHAIHALPSSISPSKSNRHHQHRRRHALWSVEEDGTSVDRSEGTTNWRLSHMSPCTTTHVSTHVAAGGRQRTTNSSMSSTDTRNAMPPPVQEAEEWFSINVTMVMIMMKRKNSDEFE